MWDNSIRRGAMMQQRTARVNVSEETIQIGQVRIRFLLTGNDSNGSVSVFEFFVPAGQKLAAPAHKNDAYEEMLYGIEGVLTWTVDGTPVEVGPGLPLTGDRLPATSLEWSRWSNETANYPVFEPLRKATYSARNVSKNPELLPLWPKRFTALSARL